MNLIEIIKSAALDAVKSYRPCDVCVGTVIEVRPLVIETDEKLILTEAFLTLSRNVTDHQTWMSFDDPGIKQRFQIYNKPEDEPVIKPTIPPPVVSELSDIQFIQTVYRKGFNVQAPLEQQNENPPDGEPKLLPTKHLITVYNHLMLGEQVLLIRRQSGQRYFVMDRLHNESEGDPIWFRKATIK